MTARAAASRAPSTPAGLRTIHRSALFTVGLFRCAARDPDFAVRASPYPCAGIVFPLLPVGIEQHGRDPFIADPASVVLYNAGQPYARRPVASEDRCVWIDVAPSLARDLTAGWSRNEQPFPRAHGPCDDAALLRLRALVRDVERNPPADALRADTLRLDESILAVIESTIGAVRAAWGDRDAQRASPAHARLVFAVRERLAADPADNATLDRLAADVGASPFHLCRVFREQTGMSLHECRTRLRLRRALDLTLAGAQDLTAVALDCGFSSHSHMTSLFRRAFGVTPSRVRAARF